MQYFSGDPVNKDLLRGLWWQPIFTLRFSLNPRRRLPQPELESTSETAPNMSSCPQLDA